MKTVSKEYLYGVVAMNTGNTLGVRYLCPIEATYKSATVYELEADDGEMNPFRMNLCLNIIRLVQLSMTWNLDV